MTRVVLECGCDWVVWGLGVTRQSWSVGVTKAVPECGCN